MVFSNGTLWTNYRMKLTGPCNMNLKRFPFDSQKCYLTFESWVAFEFSRSIIVNLIEWLNCRELLNKYHWILSEVDRGKRELILKKGKKYQLSGTTTTRARCAWSGTGRIPWWCSRYGGGYGRTVVQDTVTLHLPFFPSLRRSILWLSLIYPKVQESGYT